VFAIGDRRWPGLSKLVEECGEVIQVVGKLMATHGEESHFSGLNLAAMFVLETADVAAAVEFVVGFFDRAQRELFTLRKQEKLRLFQKWHREQAGHE